MSKTPSAKSPRRQPAATTGKQPAHTAGPTNPTPPAPQHPTRDPKLSEMLRFDHNRKPVDESQLPPRQDFLLVSKGTEADSYGSISLSESEYLILKATLRTARGYESYMTSTEARAVYLSAKDSALLLMVRTALNSIIDDRPPVSRF